MLLLTFLNHMHCSHPYRCSHPCTVLNHMHCPNHINHVNLNPGSNAPTVHDPLPFTRHLEADDLLLQLARAEQERQRAEAALVQAQTALQEMRQERAALLQEAAGRDVRIHQLQLACSHLKEQVGRCCDVAC